MDNIGYGCSYFLLFLFTLYISFANKCAEASNQASLLINDSSIAVDKGMNYATEDQIVYYKVENNNYMDQYSDIPQ